MTQTELIAEIARLTTLKADKLRQYNELKASADSWKAAGNRMVCDQILKSKREECEAAKQSNYQTANLRYSQAQTALQEANDAQAQINQLNNQLNALAEAEVNLSTQGTTATSINEIAEAQAAVIREQGSAQATNLLKEGEVATEGQRNLMWLGIGFAALILIVIAIILYRKFKKNKTA